MKNQRVLATLTVAVLSMAAVGVLMFTVDPVQAAWFPQCPSRMVTGYLCPGCGSSRGLHALVHGHIAEAWHYNAALFFALPLLAALLAGKLAGPQSRLRRIVQHPAVPITVVAATVIWTVARNI